eukprot:TRINITY_DN1212_c0_g1_i8.p1 TRINITY_DN1212_c0_g1~~TRINITY_DN1212_c0_g1_i8.p1  ORF type:complete len:204 (+),score=71.24 TRINITY_DN1212_c0_g1_i8:191-802(+)
MVDVNAVQAEARGKKLTPEEYERKIKEESEAKVKRMVDVDNVQAEARGKKLTAEEFERKAKEEAEAKVKRMVSPSTVVAEARGTKEDEEDKERIARLERRKKERDQQQQSTSTPQPTGTFASGAGLRGSEVKVNDLNLFTINVRDGSDQKLTVSKDRVKVDIKGPAEAIYDVFDNNDSSFDVEWGPTNAGDYFVNVSVDGIPG